MIELKTAVIKSKAKSVHIENEVMFTKLNVREEKCRHCKSINRSYDHSPSECWMLLPKFKINVENARESDIKQRSAGGVKNMIQKKKICTQGLNQGNGTF